MGAVARAWKTFQMSPFNGQNVNILVRVAQALENGGISASSDACGKFQQAFAQAFLRLM